MKNSFKGFSALDVKQFSTVFLIHHQVLWKKMSNSSTLRKKHATSKKNEILSGLASDFYGLRQCCIC